MQKKNVTLNPKRSECRYVRDKKEWKLPKNTRQVGDGSGDKKLYVEDYVATYLNRLSGQKETAKALLLGTVKEQNLYPYVFVDAAIEIEDFRMSEEEKIQLDKQIETEFGIKKVVGWFLSSKEKPVIYNQEILDIYKQLFQEENQVLLVADSLEDELTAFFYGGRNTDRTTRILYIL